MRHVAAKLAEMKTAFVLKSFQIDIDLGNRNKIYVGESIRRCFTHAENWTQQQQSSFSCTVLIMQLNEWNEIAAF